MGYHAATLGTAFQTFRTNAALSSSRIKTSLTTTALHFIETPANKSTEFHIPEFHNNQL